MRTVKPIIAPVCALTLMITVAGAYAQSQPKSFQISFSPKRQTVDEYLSIRGARLCFPYGRNQDVAWFDFGFVNRCEGHFAGLGIGFVMNSARDGMRGVTIGGWNNVELDANGGQVGLFNSVGFEMYGCQIGAVNLCDNLHGVQVGAFNYAWKANGLQLGVINVTGTLRGFQIGLANILTDRYRIRLLPLIRGGW